MRTTLAVCGLLASMALGGAVFPAAGAEPGLTGRNLAASCANCHGTDGHGVGGGLAILAGQDRSYLLQQLKDFKAGRRPSTIMHQLARGYSDEQLERIAEFYAAQKATK